MSQDLRPRIRLRQEDIDAIYAGAPVAEVKIYVAEEDWEPFLSIACDGMEIPVYVEGSTGMPIAGILTGADYANQAITVVI